MYAVHLLAFAAAPGLFMATELAGVELQQDTAFHDECHVAGANNVPQCTWIADGGLSQQPPSEGSGATVAGGVLAVATSAVLGGLAQEAELERGEESGAASAVWGALLEATCFFLSLAAVRIASARCGRRVAPKSRCCMCSPSPCSRGSPLKYDMESWHREKGRGPASLEALRSAAQALVTQAPEQLVDELTTHLGQHAATLARPPTVHALVEVAAQGGRPDLAEALVTAAKLRLRVHAGVRTHEILLGAFAAAGNEQKVEDLLQRESASARGYALVIKGLLRAGKVEAAMQQLLEMQRRGHEVPPRAVTELCKVAISRNVVPHTVEALGSSIPLPSDCVAVLLGDCVQREDVATGRRIELLTRSQNQPMSHGTYESLLKLHAKVDDLHAVELFEDMKNAGFTASEGLCGYLLARCAESQNLKLAEAVVAYLRSQSAMTLSTYKTLMKVYACGGLYDRACDLYEQLSAEGIQPDAVMYGCLVKFAVKCGRTSFSQEIFEKAGGGYVQNYMWLIRSAGREGDVKRALELLRKLEVSQPNGLDIMVYNCALDACVLNGKMECAQELLQEMQRTCSLNLITYNTLMKGHCAKGDMEKAREVFREMEEAGIVPDSASYNCLVSTAVTAGDMSEVWNVVHEMDRRNVPLDQYTVSIMMKASRRASDPRDAYRALEILDRAGINVCEDEVLFNTVLDACIYRRQKSRLTQAIEAYAASKMRPSVRTYGLLIKACSILKQTWRCWELWRDMVEGRHIEPNDITLSCMLDALIEGRHVEDALTLFQEWKTKVTYNTVIYSTLIKGFASAGDAERAMAAYCDMKAEGVQMNLVAYTALIDSQARTGNVAQATILLQQMEKDGCQPNTITFSNIVKGHCINGDLGEALRVFQEMLNRGLKADTVIYNTLLDGCVRHSHFELADRLLADMSKYSVEPSNFTISIVVKMWGKRKDLDKAFEVVRASLREPLGFRVDPLVGACLVGACLHNRSIDRALEALKEIKGWNRPDCPDMNTYGSLICGLARHGWCQKAVEFTDEATMLSMAGKDTLGKDTLRQLFKALQVHNCAKELGQPLAERLRARGVHVDARWVST